MLLVYSVDSQCDDCFLLSFLHAQRKDAESPVFILGISGGGEIYPPKIRNSPPKKIPTESLKLLPSDAFSRLKICQKCVCGRGCAPDPAGGAYSAPPDSLAGFKGPTFGETGRGGEEGTGRERRGQGRGGNGKEGIGEGGGDGREGHTGTSFSQLQALDTSLHLRAPKYS